MIRRLIKLFILLCIFTVGAFGLAGFALLQYLPTIKESIQLKLSAALGAKVALEDVRFEFGITPMLVLEGLSITFPESCTPTVTAKYTVADINLFQLFDRRVVIENLAIEAPTILGYLSESGLSFAESAQGLCPGSAPLPEAPLTTNVGSIPANSREAASQWEVTLASLAVTRGVLSLSTQNGELQFRDLRFTSSLEYLGTRLGIGKSNFEGMLGELPVALRATNSSIDLQSGDFEVQNGEVSIAGQTISVAGKWLAGQSEARISTTNFSLAKASKLIPNELPFLRAPISGGKISVDLSLSSSPNASLAIAGSLKATEIKTTIPNLAIDNVEFKDLKLQVRKDELVDASSTVTLGSMKVVSGREQYAIESSSGPLSYQILASGHRQVTGTLSLKSFQFNNDQTKISNVDGTISNLLSTIDHHGNVVIKGLVEGSSLKLQDPNVAIEKIQNVSSPIEVSIPTSGGYKVSGPVTCSGVAGLVLERPVTNISGTVSMLISNTTLQFKSQRITAVIEDHPIDIRTDLLFKEGQYLLKPSIITIGQGTIDIEGSLDSSPARSVTARITSDNVLLRDLLAVSAIKGSMPDKSVLTQFTLSISTNMTDFIQSAVGNGGFQITEPDKGFKRISQRLLGAIASIPLAGIPLRAIESGPSEGQNTISADFTVRNGSVYTENLVLNQPYSTVTAKGALDSAGNVQAKATAVFLQKSFSDFGIGFNRLGKLLGRAGKIEIPVIISGKASDPVVNPDLLQLAKNNSGLPLLRDVLQTAGDVAGGIMNGVMGVFEPSAR